MEQRDEELVNYKEMIPYETIIEKIHEKYPCNCLIEDEDCPYRKQLENSEETYLTLIDPETNTVVTDEGNLIAIDPITNQEISKLEKDENGYKISYKKEKDFSSPYSEAIVYSSERDKYTKVRTDCTEFTLHNYNYEVDDINKIIYLTCCNLEGGNIYIPKEYNFNNLIYQVCIKNTIDESNYYVDDNINKPKYFYDPNSFAYVQNSFFPNTLSIRNVVIEDGVKIYCNDNENDASYLFACMCNLEYARYPKEIEKADFTFAFCVSLKAVGIDKLPYSSKGLFYGCEFIEDLSYIEIPDDGSKERSDLLGDCNSLKNGKTLFKFKKEYTKPLSLTNYMNGSNNYLRTCTLESFEFPKIDNITSYKDSFTHCDYLIKVSGTISKYAKDISNLLYDCRNVSGFLNIDCIWFDEVFFERKNVFNTLSDDMSDPLVLIPADYNKEALSSYINHLAEDNNVRIQDNIDNYDYEITNDIVILKRYNGSIKRLYVPDSFIINGIEYYTVIYSGEIDNSNNSLVKKGCFSNNTSITHISIGDNVLFFNDNLAGLFFGCENLIKGIDLRDGNNYQYAYAYCSNLDGCICIDVSEDYIDNLPINIFYGITTFKDGFKFYVDSSDYNIYKNLIDNYGSNYIKSNIYNFIKDSQLDTIIKDDKEYVIINTIKNYMLRPSEDINKYIYPEENIYIPPYYWINGKKYYTCFTNPTIEDNTVSGFFQTVYNDKCNLYLINENQIIEFENDNMDYMFYGMEYVEDKYYGFIRNMKNISQNITSAQYSFYNTGVYFTKFNFGILDIRYACYSESVPTIEEYNPFTKIDLLPLANSISYMDYYLYNYSSQILNYNIIYLPYMVITADMAYYFDGSFVVEMYSFGYYENLSLSRLPLLHLKRCNYLFNKISYSESIDSFALETPSISIASDELIIEPGENILPSNKIGDKYDDYDILGRISIDYHNSKMNVDKKTVISTDINIDFSKLSVIKTYTILLFIRKSSDNKIIDTQTLSVNKSGTITYTPKDGINLHFGDEIIVVLIDGEKTTINSDYLINNIPNPWYTFSSDTEINLPIKLNIWEDSKRKLSTKIKGNFKINMNNKSFTYDEIKEKSKIIDINETDIIISTNYVVNYIDTDNKFDIVNKDGNNMAHLNLNLNQNYKITSISITNTIGYRVIIIHDNEYEELKEGIKYDVSTGEITLDKDIYLINNSNVYIGICDENNNYSDITAIKYKTDMSPKYSTNISNKSEYYLKSELIIRPDDWVLVKEEKRYRAIIPLEGSSNILDCTYRLYYDNNMYNSYNIGRKNYGMCIDKIVPKENKVIVYTKDEDCPTGDTLIDFYLLLGNEYGTVMPALPTFTDGTGNVNGKWICPFKMPYVFCESHAYNIYKAYWYNCYDKRKSYGLLDFMNINVTIPSSIKDYEIYSYNNATDYFTEPTIINDSVTIISELFYDKHIKSLNINNNIKFKNDFKYSKEDGIKMYSIELCVYIDNNDFKSNIPIEYMKEISKTNIYDYSDIRVVKLFETDIIKEIDLYDINISDFETKLFYRIYFIDGLSINTEYELNFGTKIEYKGDVI